MVADLSLPATEKVYLKDTYNFTLEGEVKVLQASSPENNDVDDDGTKAVKAPSPYCIIINRSIFHPQGGGQPCDQGIIEGYGNETDKAIRFIVEMVRDVNGVIHHYGHYDKDPALRLHVGDEVRLQVIYLKHKHQARKAS